jgi:hypothetical protein
MVPLSVQLSSHAVLTPSAKWKLTVTEVIEEMKKIYYGQLKNAKLIAINVAESFLDVALTAQDMRHSKSKAQLKRYKVL